MSMTPFPAGLPTAAIMILIDKLRGSIVPNSDLILAAWNLAGYGLSQIANDPTPVAEDVLKAAKHDDVSNDEAIEALESLMNRGSEADSDERKRLPWAKIVGIALKILLGLIII
jgi:uncharacterized protein (DUF927 family)